MANPKITDIVWAIHKKVREQSASYEAPVVLEDWSNDLARLHSAYNTAYAARNLVGSVPQLPNTLVGFVAGMVIRIAQRFLFWYTPQIRHFQEAVTSVLNRVCFLEENKFRTILALSERLESLEKDMRLLKSAPAAEPPVALPDASGQALAEPQLRSAGSYRRSAIDTRRFLFELQGQFHSHSPADMDRLKMYCSTIGCLDPQLPLGTWLDIGCGRGHWLQIVKQGGFEPAGVDSNPASVRQCRDAGFKVTQSDALEFLQSCPDQSLAVVSAFHVLEHCPFEYGLDLIYQAARTLKHGGVVLVETPHAGNLLMAAEQFWMDPSHQRPIPMKLMEFAFEYCGLTVVHRLEVNPRPEAEQLPWRELEMVNRLNLLLYGPQDYALMGRR